MIRTTLILTLLLSVWTDQTTPVEGNLFSRQIEPWEGKGENMGKTAAPAAASSILGSEAQVGSVITFHDGVVHAKLASNNRIPLAGYGVGI
jgi:hypothetical protein